VGFLLEIYCAQFVHSPLLVWEGNEKRIDRLWQNEHAEHLIFR
jgi:hypothetical protein